jgi:hypothetical protein
MNARTIAMLAALAALARAAADPATNAPADVSAPAWFPVGERMTYRLYWGVIPVGQADFWSEWVEEEGVRRIALLAQAKTTAVVAKLYPVDDFIRSVVDPATFLPLRYEQRLKEGRHFRHDFVTFHHAGGQADWEARVKRRFTRVAIDRDTRDVLSLAYFLRSRGLEAGQSDHFRVLVDEKLYDLRVEGLVVENVSVAGVSAPCLKVEPTARFGAIFVRGGRAWLWFSRDSRRICTRMVGQVPVANVKAVLTAVTGPGAAWPPPDAVPKGGAP